jgi:hypothetical protein
MNLIIFYTIFMTILSTSVWMKDFLRRSKHILFGEMFHFKLEFLIYVLNVMFLGMPVAIFEIVLYFLQKTKQKDLRVETNKHVIKFDGYVEDKTKGYPEHLILPQFALNNRIKHSEVQEELAPLFSTNHYKNNNSMININYYSNGKIVTEELSIKYYEGDV